MAIDFPQSPALNDEFTAGNTTYIWNGQGWLLKSAADDGGHTVSDVPPSNPVQGEMWLESDTMMLWMWYDDVNGGQWIQVNGVSNAGGEGGGLIPHEHAYLSDAVNNVWLGYNAGVAVVDSGFIVKRSANGTGPMMVKLASNGYDSYDAGGAHRFGVGYDETGNQDVLLYCNDAAGNPYNVLQFGAAAGAVTFRIAGGVMDTLLSYNARGPFAEPVNGEVYPVGQTLIAYTVTERERNAQVFPSLMYASRISLDQPSGTFLAGAWITRGSVPELDNLGVYHQHFNIIQRLY